MNHYDTREAIWNACVANGVPKLAYVIETKFTRRLTKSYGSAYYHKRMIYLSTGLFTDASRIKQWECIVHMTCHFIVRYKWMQSKIYRPVPRLHGSSWREAMANARVPITSAYCFTPDAERPSNHVFRCSCRNDLRFYQHLAQAVLAVPHSCAACESEVAPIT